MNDLFKQTGIVFQGNFNFNYHDKIIDKYKDYSNIVFSGWNYDKEKLNKCKNKVFSDFPFCSGVSNINYQITSTLTGLKFVEKYKYAMKIRSDILIDKLEELINLFESDKIYFPAYHNHSGGYLCEHFIWGTTEDLIKLWANIEINNNELFPERKITNSYLQNISTNIGYIFPVLFENNIKCFWTKQERCFYLNEYKYDKNFIYPKNIRDLISN